MANSPVTPLNKALIQGCMSAVMIGLQSLAEHYPDNHKVQDFVAATTAALQSAENTLLSL